MFTENNCSKNNGFESCRSFFNQCCNLASDAKGQEKFTFESCAQMMKQFCNEKTGKFDFEACRSKMSDCFEGSNEEPARKNNSSQSTSHQMTEREPQHDGE